MKCIELLEKPCFKLDDIYAFESTLKIKHPNNNNNNNNIRAKIRQQLQLLRDYNYLLFTKKGEYKLL